MSAAAGGITVIGDEALVARLLRAIGIGEVAEEVGKAALADDVATLARAYAPVETGTLQSSIDAEGGSVHTDVSYAPFVEYGTSRSPAQPFMRPAADTVDGERAEHEMKIVMDRA